MKKSKSLVFAFLIASALVGNMTVMPNPVHAAETPNLPDLMSYAYNSKNIFTECGYKGQCTWFAYGRAEEKLGISLPSEFYGNAIDWWYANLKDHVYNYGTEPKPNSIVVWYGGPQGYGHVAFVEDVVGDTVFFNEGNFQVRGNYEGRLEALSKEQIKNRGNIFLKGYIYIGEGKASSQADTSASKTGKVSLSNAGSLLNVRASNSTSSGVIGTLKHGETVKIVEQNGDWDKISYGSSYGYVYSKYITNVTASVSSAPAPSSTPSRGSVTAPSSENYVTVSLSNPSSALNFRTSPWYGRIICALSNGTKLQLLGTDGLWYKVKYNNNIGYVHSDYIKK